MKHLEPVVTKKSTSYSILFLRDDSKVVRFRLRPFWIKFLALLFLVFSGASGAAGYAAHYYWKRYTAVKFENNALEARLGESSRKLAVYSGVEVIKESSSLPRSTMAGVTSIASGGTNGKAGGDQDTPPDQPRNGSAGGNGQAGNGTSPPADASAASGQGTPAQQPQAASGSPGGEAVTETGSSGQNGDTPDQTEHPALISEVQVRSSGNKSFKLGFDLSNRDQQLTLNGRVLVAIATKSGDRHEITQINRDHLRFIINRYKRVNTSFSLPENIQAEDVARLFLTVTLEDQPSVTYTFTVPTPS